VTNVPTSLQDRDAAKEQRLKVGSIPARWQGIRDPGRLGSSGYGVVSADPESAKTRRWLPSATLAVMLEIGG
jgi:hypothetical protein